MRGKAPYRFMERTAEGLTALPFLTLLDALAWAKLRFGEIKIYRTKDNKLMAWREKRPPERMVSAFLREDAVVLQ